MGRMRILRSARQIDEPASQRDFHKRKQSSGGRRFDPLMANNEFLIAAAHKSSGKTTLSIGIINALRRRGLSVQPGKKGPDYIDPMWLASAARRPCYNYDFNTQSPHEIAALFATTDADVRLIEGNKGLYDSIDVEGRYSNAALSRLLNLPVVLVLDAEGITRGVAPLLCGYRDFENVRIAGVVLNKVASSRHESKLRAAIERYTEIPVLGVVRRNRSLTIRERHLGLVPSNEHSDSQRVIDVITAAVERDVDLDALLAATRTMTRRAGVKLEEAPIDGRGLTVAVARDEAFGFYYADDLDRLSGAGVEIVYFSPIHDQRLPACDGILIGGGFPESFAEALSENESMRESVGAFCRSGGPAYAECGGLMYLCRQLRDGDRSFPMANVIPATAAMQDRPVGRGLVRLSPLPGHPWRIAADRNGNPSINAHEFHYSRLIEAQGDFRFGFQVMRGHGVDGRSDGIVVKNTLATYVHQRHTSSNPWIEGFIRFIREQKGESGHVHQAD